MHIHEVRFGIVRSFSIYACSNLRYKVVYLGLVKTSKDLNRGGIVIVFQLYAGDEGYELAGERRDFHYQNWWSNRRREGITLGGDSPYNVVCFIPQPF